MLNSSNLLHIIKYIALMKAVAKVFSFADSSLSSGVIINLVLALVIRAPMKLMWNMINTLQLLTCLQLLALTLPTNLSICLATIKSTSDLSLIPQALTD